MCQSSKSLSFKMTLMEVQTNKTTKPITINFSSMSFGGVTAHYIHSSTEVTIHMTRSDAVSWYINISKFLPINFLYSRVFNFTDVCSCIAERHDCDHTFIFGKSIVTSCPYCKSFMHFLWNKSLFLYWTRWYLLVLEYHNTHFPSKQFVWASRTWLLQSCYVLSHPLKSFCVLHSMV